MDPVSMMSLMHGAGSFLSGLGQFAPQNERMSHERYLENEQRADWTNERDVARYNTFLTGVTPGQAANYNAYQDATFTQDTQREIDRIKAQAQQLGMSPWELKGQTGASPLPSPAFTGGGAPPTRTSQPFMQQSTEMQIAKLHAKTALGTALIQSATTGGVAAMQSAGGDLPKSQAALNKQHELTQKIEQGLKHAQTGLTIAQTGTSEQQTRESQQRVKESQQHVTESKARTSREELNTVLDIVKEVRNTLPTVTAKTPFGEARGQSNYDLLLHLIDSNTNAKNLQQLTDKDVITALDQSEKFLSAAMHGIKGMSDRSGDFLSKLGSSVDDFLNNRKWSDWRINPDNQ